MRVLAIESSTNQIQISLAENGKIRQTVTTAGKQRSAAMITPLIQSILTEHGIQPHEVAVLAISAGPGSFTGLRIGFMTVKIWAFATGCRIISIPTHKAIAWQAVEFARRQNRPEILVVSDAQQQGRFVSRWGVSCPSQPFDKKLLTPTGTPIQNHNSPRKSEQEVDPKANRFLVELEPVAVTPAADICQRDFSQVVVTGPGLTGLEGISTIPSTDASLWIPTSETIALLAMDAIERSEFADPWTMVPSYVRASAAEEKSAQRPSIDN